MSYDKIYEVKNVLELISNYSCITKNILESNTLIINNVFLIQ